MSIWTGQQQRTVQHEVDAVLVEDRLEILQKETSRSVTGARLAGKTGMLEGAGRA